MNTLLRGLEPQPDFPKVDLTEDNALMVELMLSNTAVVEAGHVSAEAVSRLFKLGHTSIISAALRLDYHDGRIGAIDYGVSAMETISGLVMAIPEEDEVGDITVNAAALAQCLGVRDLRRYVDDAVDRFVEATPLTAAVVNTAGQRFFGAHSSYVVLGAAVTSQFEDDSMAA